MKRFHKRQAFLIVKNGVSRAPLWLWTASCFSPIVSSKAGQLWSLVLIIAHTVMLHCTKTFDVELHSWKLFPSHNWFPTFCCLVVTYEHAYEMWDLVIVMSTWARVGWVSLASIEFYRASELQLVPKPKDIHEVGQNHWMYIHLWLLSKICHYSFPWRKNSNRTALGNSALEKTSCCLLRPRQLWSNTSPS